MTTEEKTTTRSVKILIIQNAETLIVAEEDQDFDLSPKGEAQAKNLNNRLQPVLNSKVNPVSYVYVSPTLSAQRTFELAFSSSEFLYPRNLNKKTFTEERLRTKEESIEEQSKLITSHVHSFLMELIQNASKTKIDGTTVVLITHDEIARELVREILNLSSRDDAARLAPADYSMWNVSY